MAHQQQSPLAGVDDEDTPPPDDLPACLSCRRRKSKCSREMPNCAQCIKLGCECQYVVKQKPGLKFGAVGALTKRLEVLERLLLDSTGNVKNQLAFLDDDAQEPSAGSPPARAGTSPVNQATQDQAAPEAGERPRKRQRVSRDYDVFDDLDNDLGMPRLPPYPLLEAVTEAHFHTVHHWIPILHETRFRARIRDAHERQGLAVLLHALVSAAIRYVDFDEFGLSIGDVTRQIRVSRNVVMMHAMQSLSVENAQALVVLAFDLMGSGQVTRAWPIIGSLTRTVDYLQLTVEPEEHSHKQSLLRHLALLGKPRDWTESEERRRLFWTVFLLDRICSVTSGWHTSLTSDDVRRRLPCGGGMWARSEPVSTPFFGIWNKSAAKIGNSLSKTAPKYPSPRPVDHGSPSSTGEVDVSKLGAFAYSIEATENLSQVTSFFLQQSVDFEDRTEVKNWLTRFKELDLRLVHWKMFLPQQWQDSDVSRDVSVIKMDPNLTLAHISHNASMILLHQHVAYPPLRWKDAVKLPSSCSAETCQLAAVETASIVSKYLRYMGGIVNSQFAFCVFIAARILLVHWQATEVNSLAPEFFSLVQSLRDMSTKWRGYCGVENSPAGDSSGRLGVHQTGNQDLAAKYAAQLQDWHTRCETDETFAPVGLTEILSDASLDGLVEKSTHATTTPSSQLNSSSGVNGASEAHRRHLSEQRFSPRDPFSPHGRGTGSNGGYLPLTHDIGSVPDHTTRNRARNRLSIAYESHGARIPPEESSPQTQPGMVRHSPATPLSASVMGTNAPQAAAPYGGIGLNNTAPHNRSNVGEEDELTAMSHMLLGNQFFEMDRVITLNGADFFSYDMGGMGGMGGMS